MAISCCCQMSFSFLDIFIHGMILFCLLVLLFFLEDLYTTKGSLHLPNFSFIAALLRQILRYGETGKIFAADFPYLVEGVSKVSLG
ncbi:hypothetical protein CEXT_167991 [Caerostris extrusa]|uniref:Uncharacterized protein n=1 Tax=Caerostris extrusa TaxID=172846 RepID=A0AAV4VUM8_CAEEX|nr:hypothetical protein CEXT_167991 [Caerostris extrusa]